MHAGTAPGGADDDEGQPVRGGPLDQSRQPFAHHAPHTPHDEGGVGHAAGNAAGPDHARARDGRIAHPSPLLLGDDSVGIRPFVAEAERVGGPESGIPFLEGAGVEQLRNPLMRRHIPVEAALRADIEHLLRFFAVDGGGTAVALLPQPFRNAAFDVDGTGRGCRPGSV